MSDNDSPRMRLVELLWQLKQSYDQHDENDQRFIHFNTLLNDSHYRDEVIERASHSSRPAVRELARRLRELNRDGTLLLRRPEMPQAFSPADSPAALASPARHRWRWFSAMVTVALLVMLAVLFREDWRALWSGQRVVQGTLTGDRVWSADTTWVLEGLVYVKDGSLTIEAGTRIHGRPGSALIIARTGKVFARGSQPAPVVFTSAGSPGNRQAGDWGGLVLLGTAPVNVAEATVEGIVGNTALNRFGGNQPQSSCGLLEYVRIEFAGYEISRGNELNSLTLAGCGSGTIVRNVQVHRGLDDGVEVFGGTVDLKNVVITGAGDDALDWDLGWRGRVQFLVVQQYADIGDNAFEGDNNKDDPNATPRSAPTLYNITLISPRSSTRYHRTMTLRRGTAGQFRNVIATGFSGELIDIAGTDSARLAGNGKLGFAGMIAYDIGANGLGWFASEHGERDDDGGFQEARLQRPDAGMLFGMDPQLPPAATRPDNPDFSPGRQSPARHHAVRPPAGEFWNQAATYMGAVKPGLSDTWLDGWTAFPRQ